MFKKIRRLLLQALLLILVVLIGAFTLNTIKFGSRQVPVAPVTTKDISDRVVKRLSEVIQIPTVSYETHIDTSAFVDFKNYLRENFPLVDSLLQKEFVNNYSITYKWPGTNPKLDPILLLGHIDVVPVEDESLARWTEPPYSGKIKDGFIWGRGALDDKVNILGVLEAVNILLEEGYQPERGIYLAFGHDEEVSGHNGAKAIATKFENEGLRFEYVLDEGLVVLENALPGLNRPATLIGIAEKGYASLIVTAELEEGGHSSMPPKETAIGLLANTLKKLEENPFPAKISGPTEMLFDHVGPEMSMPNKLVFANIWFFENILIKQLGKQASANAIVRTTMAPTILKAGLKDNVMPTTASATINFRIIPGETVETVKQHLHQVINDERIKVTVGQAAFSSNPSKVSSVESFGFNAIQKTAQEIFPEGVIAPSLVIAATDSRHYENVANDTYRFMPLQTTIHDLHRIHGIDERIAVEDYKKLVHFYYQLMKNSCY
ncbi:MAG: carboxypeptidase PM20D1 [Polaribacter sp.]|jgi:carboxypeptidase PM20D1